MKDAYNKMKTHMLSFYEVIDILSISIIVANEPDCYSVLGVVHSIYKPVPGRFNDYIAIPTKYGYRALQTTLFGPRGLPVSITIYTNQMERFSKECPLSWVPAL